MKKIFLLFIFILVLLSVTSAVIADDDNETEDEIECAVDTDCAEGLFCIDGECEDESSDDIPECAVDADCTEGYYCDEKGECEDISDDENECTVDTDCAEGYYCDDGECEDKEDDSVNDDVSDETGEELDDDEAAEEDENEEIEDEAKFFQTNLGAEIRLMLLEKSVYYAIARGEIVIDYLEDKYGAAEVQYISDLNGILDKLSSVLTEITKTRDSGEFSVDVYVSLRKDSWDLVRQFKRIVWENTSPVDREELRKLLSEADYSFMDELKEQIKMRIREHNAEKVKEIRERMGSDDSDFSDDVKSGRISSEEARQKLMDEYKKMAEERRLEAEKKLAEAREEAEKKRMEARERINEDTEEAQRARIEYRERMEEKAEELRKELRTRITDENGEIRIREDIRIRR